MSYHLSKEAMRKLLEDCWDAGMSNAMIGQPDKSIYITTRLAALDDGVAEVKSTGGFKKRIVDLFKTMPNESECDMADILYRLQFILDEYKESILPKPVDDGQEGKGLRWVKAEEGFPAFNGLFVCRIVKKGNGERSEKVSYIQHTNGHFFMPNDDGFKVTEWLDESAALPVADGEGEKEGDDEMMERALEKSKLPSPHNLPSAVTGGVKDVFELVDKLLSVMDVPKNRSDTENDQFKLFQERWSEYGILKSKYLSEGQPAQGGKPFLEGKEEK